MNNKEQFDFYKSNGLLIHLTAEQRITQLVEQLIQVLFKPDEGETTFVPDWEKIEKLGINPKEPLNWMSLHPTVETHEEADHYLITLDEASPGECPTLCAYIEKYMHTWGWRVTMETEW